MENENQDQPVVENVPPQPTPQGEVIQSAVVSPTPKKNKKPLIILLVIATVLLIGAAVWYFVLKDRDANQTYTQSASQTEQTGELAKGLAGGSLVFASHEEGSTLYQLSAMQLTGDQTVTKRQEVDLISQTATYEDKVALATEDQGTVIIWVSQDSGATYENVLERKGTEGAMTYQVTSMVFAEDGSSLAIALLNDTTNTVTDITLADKSTKDVYESEKAGVFLEAYNKSAGQLVFFEGCYNCDGNTMTDLLLRDLKANTTKSLLQTDTPISVAANQKATSLVIEYGAEDTEPEEGMGIATKAPYTLARIDITSGSKTPLLTSNELVTQIGFTADTSEPYFVSGNKVTKIAVDKQIVLFESETSPIFSVYYASQEGLVLATGTYDGFTVYTYMQESKSFIKLQQGSPSTLLIVGAAVKQ